MDINATFLVQIINFFVIYKVLTVFFFKPIIASLEEKKAKKESLEKSIKEKEEVLVSLEKQKKEEIKVFQEHVKTEYPFISPTETDKPVEMEVKIKKEADTKELKNKVVDLLVSKVPHDC